VFEVTTRLAEVADADEVSGEKQRGPRDSRSGLLGLAKMRTSMTALDGTWAQEIPRRARRSVVDRDQRLRQSAAPTPASSPSLLATQLRPSRASVGRWRWPAGCRSISFHADADGARVKCMGATANAPSTTGVMSAQTAPPTSPRRRRREILQQPSIQSSAARALPW